MDRKELLKSLAEDLGKRRRAIDALRLLLEDGDAETALAMSERLRADFDAIARKLGAVMGKEAPSGDAAPTPVDAAPLPDPAPLPDAPPPPPPAPASRGYLGDSQEAGGFEKWVERIIDGCWHAVTHPKVVLDGLASWKNTLIFVGALGLAMYTGWNAYQKAYLSRHGLVGEYYLDESLKSLYTKRTDPAINFRWLRRAPMSGFRSEHFSIRWTGYVRVEEGGPHEFYTISDDGVRLWIDDQKLIDHWDVHGSTLDKGEITLKPGHHRVRLEYFQGEGDSVMKLQWKRPSDTEKRTISPRHLFPRLPEG